MSQARVSQHLADLGAESVGRARREGPRVFCRSMEPRVQPILACIRDGNLAKLADGPVATPFDLAGDA